MSDILKIQWIIIIAKNIELLKEYYSKKVGLRIVRDEAKGGLVQFQIGQQFFALYSYEKVVEVLGSEYVTNDFIRAKTIYSFSEPDNFDDVFDQLKSQGVEFIKEPEVQPWGQKTAYFKDPEGNIWELQKWIK